LILLAFCGTAEGVPFQNSAAIRVFQQAVKPCPFKAATQEEYFSTLGSRPPFKMNLCDQFRKCHRFQSLEWDSG
jgi:hypothetical protein